MATTGWEVVEPTWPILRAAYPLGAAVEANAVAVGLGGGRLLLLSPPAAPAGPALLDALATWGEVVAVVAPNAMHRAGVGLAARRFPNATLHAPAGGEARVAAVAGGRPVTAVDTLDLPAHVRLEVPDHLRLPEVVGRFRTPGGVVWYVNDLITNLERLPANFVLRGLLRLLSFDTGLRPNTFAWRWRIVRDGDALEAWLRRALAEDPPVALVVGHGPVVTDPALLAGLADRVHALR